MKILSAINASRTDHHHLYLWPVQISSDNCYQKPDEGIGEVGRGSRQVCSVIFRQVKLLFDYDN